MDFDATIVKCSPPLFKKQHSFVTMRSVTHCLAVLCLLVAGSVAYEAAVEEFHAHGPMEFHDLAINAFLEMKKSDPSISLGHDSPFLERATKHAIKRLARKPSEEFELKVKSCFRPFASEVV